MRMPFEWKQGQHMSIIGNTGSGKTTLCGYLLRSRKYVISIRTKADQKETLPGKMIRTESALEKQNISTQPKYILFPNPPRVNQSYQIRKATELVWAEGGWCIYFDELFYISQRLKIDEEIDTLLTQGRSRGISVVTGMQRPVNITRFAMSQSTHLISFRTEGRDTATHLKSINAEWASAVAGLKGHDFAWLQQETGEIWVGNVNNLRGNSGV